MYYHQHIYFNTIRINSSGEILHYGSNIATCSILRIGSLPSVRKLINLFAKQALQLYVDSSHYNNLNYIYIFLHEHTCTP